MSPYSKESILWRKNNEKFIIEWQKRIEDLRNLGHLENWTYERLEFEIAQRLATDLRRIYDFACSYTRRYKTGKFRKYMADAVREIIDYGVVEPNRLKRLQKAIETTVRRMNEKK